jgi:hypothetical protein
MRQTTLNKQLLGMGTRGTTQPFVEEPGEFDR